MTPANGSTHPSPHAQQVSLLHQAVGVAAAPVAWVIRLMANLALASSACLPGSPLPGEPLSGRSAGPAMYGVDTAALLVALAAAFLAYRDWRSTKAEKPGSHHHLLEVGEGRARFLALSGIIVSLGFALATIFDVLALLIVPLCEHFA
jgi:hypothetical protein